MSIDINVNDLLSIKMKTLADGGCHFMGAQSSKKAYKLNQKCQKRGSQLVALGVEGTSIMDEGDKLILFAPIGSQINLNRVAALLLPLTPDLKIGQYI